MNKKISELVADLDLELLKDIKIEEDDMNSEENISLENIKQKAMAGIQQTSEHKKVTPLQAKSSQKKRKMKRMFIPLVAATLLIGATVAAVSSNEHFRNLFGDSFALVEGQVQGVKATDVKNGIIFSVEEAIIDNKSGLIMVSFAKEDGTTFEEGVDSFGLEVALNKKGGLGWSRQTFLAEDRKKLFSIMDLSASNKLYNHEMTITATDIGMWKEGETQLDINLEEMLLASNHSSKNSWEEYTREEALNKILTEEIPSLKLDQVTFNEGMLEIISSYLDESGKGDLNTRLQLIDTRTGEVIDHKSGNGSWRPEESIYKFRHIFDGITKEDLPYLTMTMGYSFPEPVVKGKWQVKFKLDKNKNILKVKPSVTIMKDELKLKIQEIEVSALGVKIEGTKNAKLMQNVEAQLILKNGDKLPLTVSATSTQFNHTFVQQLIVAEEAEVSDDHKSQGTVNGSDTSSQGLGVSSMSVSTQSQDGQVSMPYLIDLKEVESIIIEGVVIPIV